MADGAVRDRRAQLADGFRSGSSVGSARFLPGDLPDAIQIGVIAPDQLDQDGFLGFEVVIQASREDPAGVRDLLEGSPQTRGGDQRRRRFEDLGSAGAIPLTVFHSTHGLTVRPGYAVMPSRLQTPTTSSKIDIGTVNDFVAETSVR